MPHLAYPDLLYVEPVQDGLLVKLRTMFLDEHDVRDLEPELYALSYERGGPHLYLDLAEVEDLPEPVIGQLAYLGRRLQAVGDRLILLNLRPHVYAALRAHPEADGLVLHGAA